MNVLIIPGFTGYPEEKTFQQLEIDLTSKGHNVIKIAWPNIPDNLNEYNFTNTIRHAKRVLDKLNRAKTVILGFSMGGVVACELAKEFHPYKLGLIVSPYQAGSDDDLQGKYQNWKELGYRDITSSRFGDLRIPFSFIEDARQYNALASISQITCPTLFIAGDKDDKVSNFATRKLFDKANEPKEWVLIKGMEHKYQHQEEKLRQVNELLVSFICDLSQTV